MHHICVTNEDIKIYWHCLLSVKSISNNAGHNNTFHLIKSVLAWICRHYYSQSLKEHLVSFHWGMKCEDGYSCK